MNKSRLAKFWRDNRGFIVFFSLMLVARSSFADWYHIPSASMKPNLIEGDRVLVNKMAYRLDIPFTDIAIMPIAQPQRGDIITFESKAAEQRMIKRVIGIPGDIVSMHNNKLIINGEIATYQTKDSRVLKESVAKHNRQIQLTATEQQDFQSFQAVTVPKDHLLVLGDNRNNSADSRYYGFIPMDEVSGKALKVIASFNPDNYYIPRENRFMETL